MHCSKNRALALGVVMAAVALVWTIPAFAHKSAASASVSVTMGKPSEFGYVLSTKTVAHGKVTFAISNKGNLPHDFKICASNKGGTATACTGTGSAQVSPGAMGTFSYTFKTPGSYEYLCTLPGHAAGGMKGILKVT